MGARSGIEWTESTWSPVNGCTRVSPGCGGPGNFGGCYAETLAGRFCGPGLPMEGFATLTSSGARWTGRVELDASRLDVPARWRRGRKVFVNSQSDTFHEKLTDDEVAAVFGAMAAAPQHRFLVLTKRPKRMRAWFEWFRATEVAPGRRFVVPALVEHAACAAEKAGHRDVADRLFRAANDTAGRNMWPLPNVVLMASVEDQPRADERLDDLLRTPAVAHGVSCEPLLGPVSLVPWLSSHCDEHDGPGFFCTFSCPQRRPGLAWVIAGGESGQNPRPMHPAWAASLRDQCRAWDVAYFFKQWGAWTPTTANPESSRKRADHARFRVVNAAGGHGLHGEGALYMEKKTKKAAGALLDGVKIQEWPEVLRG